MVSNASHRRKGIYLLPNLFTTAGLFAAFYAIIAAMRGQFEISAIAIFIAMIADTIDGRVARLANAQTDFGAEYDSLSDMVSFGLAPSVLVYAWSLSHLGKPGWLVSFLYTACTALRLARFNAQLGVANKRYFQGLPCPSAAAVLASLVWFGNNHMENHMISPYIVAFVTVIVAILMVSNVRYHSFKEYDRKERVPFIAILLVVLIFVGISIDPPLMLFVAYTIYVLSGPVLTLWHLRKSRTK